MGDRHILVVGSYNVGLCTAGDRIPGPGQTLMARRFFEVPGGKGSNQALAAARLGARVRFLAKVGDDAFGRAARELHAANGVPGNTILTEAGLHTGVGLVIVDGQGRNAISVALGANERLTPADCEAHAALFASASHVLLQLETPIPTVRRAVAMARAAKACVVLNPAPAMPLEDDLLASIDLITPNEHEAAELTGIACDTLESAAAAGRALIARGVGRAIITLGHRGSLLVEPAGTWHCPATTVDAIDTTGAGDAYNGALVAELAAGAGLREAMAVASRVAAWCVRYVGVVDGLPTRTELLTLSAAR